ncbi:MAG: dimethylmenaquinone methyltransferase [Gemmatimonadetes bacterium]|nr:dimethylmenaquinone methyltransferase [Gemmatimonadota bacterium]|tara:strand:+ start:1102 stop:1830 length:729 start_codon:yes stop_codon:yes gene_type:complete
MSTKGLSQEDLDLLRKYDTPTICNVIEIFEVRPRNEGYMDSRIKACFPEMPPMVGYASTATYRSDAPPGAGDVYSSIDKQVSAFEGIPGPPVVVFQDLDDPSVAATFGEVMCTTYKTFGAVGLVTSGTARDLDQVREIGFPAFSNGAICAHAYCHTISIHVPVRVGGITVKPGELLHGDCNGVTTIPNEIASAVAQACAEYVEAEEIVLEHLKSGSATPDTLGNARRECADRIQELSNRVKI